MVVVLGLGTIVYARQSVPSVSADGPTINDHWHAVYGFYICDEWYTLGGDLENLDSQGRLTSTPYLQTGVHSHDDGIIHWHPFTSRAVGSRATLGVFLDVYGVQLDETRLVFPAGQPTEGIDLTEFIPGETTCDGEDAELSVVVWPNALDTGKGSRYIANFSNIRIQNDGMVFAIAFVPRGGDVPMPPWAPELSQRAMADLSGLSPQQLVEQGLLPADFDLSQFDLSQLDSDGDGSGDGDAPADEAETNDGDGSDD